MWKMVKFALGAAAIAALIKNREAIMAFMKGEPAPSATHTDEK